MGAAPELPTMSELGYPMDIRSWWAALVPMATPKPIVDQLNGWFNQVVANAETKAFLNSIASDPWVTKPDEAQAYFRQQVKDWGDYVRIAKIEQQ
jgi:tripartite-type tricarboxylate transporter receptor subunit TctC